jgi:hypothetical protein
VLDGGLREFAEDPATSWEPLAGGALGEYISTRAYRDTDDRQVPHQFLPGAWEPFWGIEDERPLALGHFADSMVPLHGYRLAVDLRSTNELLLAGKGEMRDTGIYCGPGLWFDRRTGRVHIRLAHHQLAGLGDRDYRGPTDPRRLPLVVAAGFGGDVLRISGVKHVRIRELVLRGATGSPLLHVYGSEDIALDHLLLQHGPAPDARLPRCLPVRPGITGPAQHRAQRLQQHLRAGRPHARRRAHRDDAGRECSGRGQPDLGTRRRPGARA